MIEQKQVDWKRIGIFTAIAFGIAWIAGLVIYQRGGIFNSPELVPDSGLTEAVVLMATAYMFAPAISHILTRLITREGWKNLRISFNFRQGLGLYPAGLVRHPAADRRRDGDLLCLLPPAF